jgi:transcriptional regulator with XRE-family HTH domain
MCNKTKTSKAGRFDMFVGLQLKSLLVQHDVTQTEMAHRLSRAPSSLSDWFNGKRTMPVSVLYDMCDELHTDPGLVLSVAWERVHENGH